MIPFLVVAATGAGLLWVGYVAGRQKEAERHRAPATPFRSSWINTRTGVYLRIEASEHMPLRASEGWVQVDHLEEVS